MRRTVSVVLSSLVILAMVATATGASGAQRKLTAKTLRPVGQPIQGAKSASGKLARSDGSLLRQKGTKLVNVMVKLDYDAVASYAGGLNAIPATSPSVTGRSLKTNAAGVDRYLAFVAGFESSVREAIARQVPTATVTQSFRVAYGGLALRVPAYRAGDLLRVPGIVAVQQDSLEQPQTSVTPEFLGADKVWPELGGQDHAGDNVIVANIDTGVWPEHPSFRDRGLPAPGGGPFGCQFGDGSDPDLGDPFTCNNKLIGAYAFTDTYLSVFDPLPGEFCDAAIGACSPRDADGHGTHTLSTAAGDRVNSAKIFGIQRGPISGMAPGAHVIAYRVCLTNGCFESDSVAAVQQAILDGVNVLNFSISGGADPYSDPGELAFLDAYAAGILVNASAGNAGPGAGTSDHGGPWVDTVGASYSPRNFLTKLHLHASNGDTFKATGSSLTHAISKSTRVVNAADIAGYNDPLCTTALAAGAADGQIVICERSLPGPASVGRNQKSFNVSQGGAVGMILYNPVHMDLFTDNFWIPTVMLDAGTFRGEQQPAEAMLDFVASHKKVTAQWDVGQPQDVQPDIMTTFSSKGPVGDWIKPNVTAPGIQILAGNSPESIDVASGPNGELFQSIAGTSMSAPHATGVAALVKAVHPDWSSGQILSALMTSSVQDVLKEDGVTPFDPFDAGSGSIRADRAASPTLTFNVRASDYYAAADDSLHHVDLNLPSIDATVMPGILTTTRRGLNVSDVKQTFTVHTAAPAGASIEVTPSEFTLDPKERQSLRITISGESLAEGQYFGSITLDAKSKKSTDVYMPVAFERTQGDVSLMHTCSPTTVGVGESAACSVTMNNLAPVDTGVHLRLKTPDDQGVHIKSVSSPGVATATGFTFDGTLAQAQAPIIDSITPGGAGFGYLPLSSLGVTPVSGVGDETIVNFTTSPYLFGNESYSQVAMTSDGYAVVGGGDESDLNFIPQTLPDPGRPNNVLAPFWTDLNPEDGGGLYAAELTDGVSNWVVLDWENVPTYGTTKDQSFEIWLITDPGVEQTTFDFGTIQGNGASTGLDEGAENRDGSSGVNMSPFGQSGDEFQVNTSPPANGGSVTITYDAKGKAAGTYDIAARLRADEVLGTTSEVVTLTVTTP